MFTGESKPDTWLEDYRVAVQIGGGNDEVAMKHLPLMLEGSTRAWPNQLAPGSIYTWKILLEYLSEHLKVLASGQQG